MLMIGGWGGDVVVIRVRVRIIGIMGFFFN